MAGSKIKKEKVTIVGKRLPGREMVVKEKSEKDKSDFKKKSQDEKMKHHHYLQKGIKINSPSSPPPLWIQNRYQMPSFGRRSGGCSPLHPQHPRPGSRRSASPHSLAQPRSQPGVGSATEHLSPAQKISRNASADFQGHQFATSHSLSYTFSYF